MMITDNPDLNQAQLDNLIALSAEYQARAASYEADVNCRNAQTQQYYVDNIKILLETNTFRPDLVVRAVVTNDLSLLLDEPTNDLKSQVLIT